MAHTATIDIDVKDASVVVKAAQRLGFEVQEKGEVRLYDGTVARGIVVSLPGWKYPIVIDPDCEWTDVLEDGSEVVRKGKVYSDNYNGSWGQQSYMDEFRQIYGVEKAEFEAEQAGYTWNEDIVLHPETGEEEIEVTINMPGGDLDGGADLNYPGGGLTL